MSDHAGAVADEEGIDAFELTDWVRERGTVAGFPEACGSNPMTSGRYQPTS
ncbi:MAG: hypothetical protein CM1200mP26_06850 [Acidimicrobiales bacterium]|nr:MAG: hypothetical protein CM1200mP26_06850 [Acidimicrobiales bacterium]